MFWTKVLIVSSPFADREGPAVRASPVPAQGDVRGRLPRRAGHAAQVLHRRHLRQGPQAEDTEGGRQLLFKGKFFYYNKHFVNFDINQ